MYVIQVCKRMDMICQSVLNQGAGANYLIIVESYLFLFELTPSSGRDQDGMEGCCLTAWLQKDAVFVPHSSHHIFP